MGGRGAGVLCSDASKGIIPSQGGGERRSGNPERVLCFRGGGDDRGRETRTGEMSWHQRGEGRATGVVSEWILLMRAVCVLAVVMI